MSTSSAIGVRAGARADDLVATIRANRRSGVPTLVFGAPGVGKSQQVHQAADGDPVIDIRLSMLDPVDLRGLPMVKDGEVRWARPDFLPSEGAGILLFDELNTAPVAVQNAALQLILDRRCGPHVLGDGWYIVACGNRATHRAHVNPISAPLRNRFAIFDYEPSAQRWTRWALEHDVHRDVVAFLNFSPDYLVSEPNDEYGNFASPRSWERVSAFIKAGISDVESITSLVGRGSAVAFEAFRAEIAAMPNIDALIGGNASWEHDPRRISVTYAVAMALAGHLGRAARSGAVDPGAVDRAAGIVAKVPPEIAALFFTSCDLGPSPLAEAIRLSPNLAAFCAAHAGLLRRYGLSGDRLIDAMSRKAPVR
jgi:hypothetical protein